MREKNPVSVIKSDSVRSILQASLLKIVNLVIVGAGISGLTPAYKIKDRLDVKVIEKEPKPGGSWKTAIRGLMNPAYIRYIALSEAKRETCF